jgi:hypothetical protein
MLEDPFGDAAVMDGNRILPPARRSGAVPGRQLQRISRYFHQEETPGRGPEDGFHELRGPLDDFFEGGRPEKRKDHFGIAVEYGATVRNLGIGRIEETSGF